MFTCSKQDYHTQIVCMVGKHLNVNFELVVLTEADRSEKSMKQKNPFDRFPMLECAEGVLFDTLAICKFLDTQKVLIGDTPIARSRIISDIKQIED